MAISMYSSTLFIREKTDGVWRYRRVKEGHRLKTGDLTPPFFTRRRMDGKPGLERPVRRRTFKEAKKEAAHLGSAVETDIREVTHARTRPQRTVNPPPPRPPRSDTYLEQKSGKSRKDCLSIQTNSPSSSGKLLTGRSDT